jgi:hypothetical protein
MSTVKRGTNAARKARKKMNDILETLRTAAWIWMQLPKISKTREERWNNNFKVFSTQAGVDWEFIDALCPKEINTTIRADIAQKFGEDFVTIIDVGVLHWGNLFNPEISLELAPWAFVKLYYEADKETTPKRSEVISVVQSLC